LLQERDQMAALLKLNEAGRIQDLIEQNMSLAKNLREANEKVERLNRESNADKDAITDALRDLAIAKSQINSLHQEKREQDQRLADLEAACRTRSARSLRARPPRIPPKSRSCAISSSASSASRNAAARRATCSSRPPRNSAPRTNASPRPSNSSTPRKSPSPRRTETHREPPGGRRVRLPFARDRAAVGQATAELNRDIAVFERTAEKSFVAGRLLPTRELYQMILEQHPGHTPTLCKIGRGAPQAQGTRCRRGCTFRRAIEWTPPTLRLPHARLFPHENSATCPAAEQAVRRAVDLAPTDAKSQMLLATLCYRLGRIGEAESHFKAAITADPMPSEPYYNLALICSRDRRIEDAKNYYQQALERGALPDPELEDSLAKQ
jgi:tetratricopeptide (TPR) repeat protein